MRARDLWVDFNDIDAASRVSTLSGYAEPGVRPVVGARLVVGDDEGNRCEADVVSITGAVIVLAVDGNTFSTADGDKPAALIEA